MENEIIFLGTAGNITVASKNLRKSGGIIIRAGEIQLHIDPGPGALRSAAEANVNLRENTAVLVSHAHLNHCNDVNAVLAAMTHNKLDVKGILIGNESFLKDPTLSVMTRFAETCAEKIILAEQGKNIAIEDIEIEFIKTLHKDSSIGFKIKTPKFILTYSGDTSYDREIIDQYLQSDILILNVPFPFGEKEHLLNSDDAVNILKFVKPQVAIITHFGNKMISASPIYEAREIQKQSGVPTLAAEDGMHIDPLAYSKERTQKMVDFLAKEKP